MPTSLENNTHIETFQFGEFALRSVLVEGEPWFLGADLAAVLEYRDGYTLLRGLEDEDKQVIDVSQITTHSSRGNPNKTFISEAGLYTAIIRANTQRVKPFRRWVTSEVLPQIRKTGSYETPKSEAEIVLEAMQILTAQVEAHRAELEAARPKVEVYDRVLTPENTFGFRDLAKTLREHFPITEADLRRVLREKKILTPTGGLDVYSAAIDAGWAIRRPVGSWGNRERFQPRFTTKTLNWLLDELSPLEGLAA